MYPKEILQKIYLSVPEEIVEIIASPETFDTLSEIAAKNNLSVEQLEKLQLCVGYRLMGIFSKQTLLPKIKENLNLPDPLAATIGVSLEQEIISKVPSDLLTHQEETASNIIKESGKQDGPKNTPGNLLEIPPEDLPATIPGEKVHDTAPQNKPFQTPPAPTPAPSVPVNLPTDSNVPTFEKRPEFNAPQPQEKPVVAEKKEETKPEPTKTPAPTHYPPGLDPYREPIE